MTNSEAAAILARADPAAPFCFFAPQLGVAIEVTAIVPIAYGAYCSGPVEVSRGSFVVAFEAGL